MDLVANIGSGTLLEVVQLSNYTSVVKVLIEVIIHQRRGYLGEWANADKIDLLILLLNFRIVRRKVKLLEIDALDDRTELTSI
jgi:hypothetical protein